jgi:hypothetical protein
MSFLVLAEFRDETDVLESVRSVKKPIVRENVLWSLNSNDFVSLFLQSQEFSSWLTYLSPESVERCEFNLTDRSLKMSFKCNEIGR